ncbi:heme oxygenase [Thraustotheca clavata]|uniref:Heme oxygenase n=1 Tax=Thraustotheca clavata TaxID=74557 RepID=A0A1W0A5C2_9STRA|nr:heme oxygenase [Thraustotheca clavata]
MLMEAQCPAFASSCPFAAVKANSCPYFNAGCPFKDASDMLMIQQQLEEAIPKSHHEQGTAAKEVLDMFKHIHQVSVAKKEELGACPVFVTTCPFKTIVKNGRPLVDELELRTWGIFDNDDIVSQQIEGHLAKDLKYGTKKSHKEAENVHFIREFIKGNINKDAYMTMVAMFYYIYSELEQQMRLAFTMKNPVFSPLHFPQELERKEALEADLAYYFGSEWATTMPAPTKATEEYIARLQHVGANEPSVLVSHAYTRYLGDLSGGQLLKRIAIKSLGLKDGNGTAFYDFNKMAQSHKQFKNMYRRTLDNLQVDEAMSTRLVDEANLAFLLNMKIFEELDVMSGFNTVENQQIQAELRRKEGEISQEVKKQGGVCPFAKMMGQPGVKELALKYHGADLTTEEFDELKTEYDTVKLNSQKKLLKQFGVSIVILVAAISISIYSNHF